ncbi:MAG: hypothetical protein H3Z53_08885 [archaeon]|nr:hypothetical protein [archaeon]
MVKEGYQPLALPKKIVERIKLIVESEDSLYTNMTDFVKEAIREKIDRIEQSKNKQRT